jgi:hypothetical protein
MVFESFWACRYDPEVYTAGEVAERFSALDIELRKVAQSVGAAVYQRKINGNSLEGSASYLLNIDDKLTRAKISFLTDMEKRVLRMEMTVRHFQPIGKLLKHVNFESIAKSACLDCIETRRVE